MEVLITANGALTLVVVPTNEMEVQMLKQLAIQNNEIVFTDNGITIVNKSVPQGLVISKHTGSAPLSNDNQEQTDSESNEDNKEEL